MSARVSRCVIAVFLLACSGSSQFADAEDAARVIVQPVDFDRDGKIDPAEYTLADSYWRVQLSTYNYTQVAVPYGNATCVPTSGDYDGDGIPEIAAFDTATGKFYTMISGYGYFEVVLDMGSGTEPVRGDYDGDGCDDPTVYDGNTGYWTVRLSTFGYTAVSFPYGNSEIVPVSGDFDGDGKSDIACYRESDGTWWFLLSSFGGYEISISPFGGEGWSPVAGDFDGDGKSDYSLYNRADGTWYMALSLYGYAVIGLYGFGGEDYAPLTADFNGDGYDEPAVYSGTTRTVTAHYFVSSSSETPTETNTVSSSAMQLGAGRGDDGSLGLLYGQTATVEYGDFSVTYKTNMYFIGYDANGAAWVNSELKINNRAISAPPASAVLFDANGEPNVFVGYPSGSINRLWLENGAWKSETLVSGLSTSGQILGRKDGLGVFHLLLCDEGLGDAEITFVYLTNPGGVWTTEVFTYSKSSDMYSTGVDMAVSSDGTPWVAFGILEQLGDDVYWPGYLYCMRKSNGAWVSEQAAFISDSSNDTAYRDPSIAITPSGQPVIACRLKYNVITGSDSLSELTVTSRSASGSWSTEIIANVADGYFGSDGGNFTGLYPSIAIDQNGANHIIFSDLASSHESGYEVCWFGQIRYATNRSGSWQLSTLLRQSAANEEEIMDKLLLLSPDAQQMDIIATVYDPVNAYVVKRLTNRGRSAFTFF